MDAQKDWGFDETHQDRKLTKAENCRRKLSVEQDFKTGSLLALPTKHNNLSRLSFLTLHGPDVNEGATLNLTMHPKFPAAPKIVWHV